jgi:hypothetical protein
MIFHHKDAIAARESLQEAATLPDWFIRRTVNPKPPSEAQVRQAAYSAQALEDDRRLSDVG